MTEKEAITLVGMLFAAYPKFEAPKATIKLYQQFLQDLDFNLARAAVTKHIAVSQYFPTIAELRDAALSLTNKTPSASDAWCEVMEQISKIGSYGAPKFSHPAIKKAVNAIGWTNLCWSEEIGVERAHFLKIYEVYRKREVENAKILPLFKKLGLKMPEMPALPEETVS
ncbi:replicative helicase loader/inhibitor [Desulfallas thermosapovorans]|uniref:Loader and inhibitor of G40P protein n=1 Tax=Desulfallas thermosapovorans DSM 6562 TaxID=1121431 RepID=A0A5S4ZQU0_9FIRM|nr:replicative helicase loader/inhibitor [Desulfallas thermosapovorans]TYO95146.1 loader and inhibitor of G40P protein [Desulfallas thermosapovorans DSM 6562]